MLFNVAQLLQEGVGATRCHDIAGELYDIDAHNPGPVPVVGRVVLTRTPNGILVEGDAHVELIEPCRRCLESVENTASFEFEEEFKPSIDVETGALLPVVADDERELLIDEHHVLDLTEVLRQYAVMATDLPGLCRPDCNGLCPVCGKNLNEGPCECERAVGDPRLAVLAKLLGTESDTS